MGNFTEESTYAGNVEKYEVDTPVQGGAETSPSNLPLKRLTNRTTWLKNAYDALKAAYDAFVASMSSIYYNKSEIDTKFSNLVNGAPGILDTLGEIATSLNNNSNLAGTLTSSINNVAQSVTNEANTRSQADTDEANARAAADSDIKNNTLGGVKIKVVEIGDWNMDATGSIMVNHGLSSNTVILDVHVIIRNDANIVRRGLCPHGFYGLYTYDPYFGAIELNRIADGMFDNVDYDSTGYNRGWITIMYQ